MRAKRVPPRRHILAAGALLFAVAIYMVVLAPITDVFTVPIHQNGLTGLGKMVMARVGPIQALAIVVAILILGSSTIIPSGARPYFRTAALGALVIAAIILTAECLMIVAWAVTLWHFSDAAAGDFGSQLGVSTWSVGWHVQIVVGLLLLLVAWMVTIASLHHRESALR